MIKSHTHILVVDDESLVLLNLVAYLDDEGYCVHSAKSSQEALQLLITTNIDVGIIDMRMPMMDGNELICQAHELQPKMQFLVHTGSRNYELPTELRALGMQNKDVLAKPLADMSVLTNAIQRLLRKKSQNAE